VKNAPYYASPTVACKDSIQAMFHVKEPGPKHIHISQYVLDKQPNLLEMLTEERRIKHKSKDGKVRVSWGKKHDKAPNEGWDVLNYNLAAKHFAVLSGFQFVSELTSVRSTPEEVADVEAEILPQNETVLKSKVKAPRKRRPKSGWLSGGGSRRF